SVRSNSRSVRDDNQKATTKSNSKQQILPLRGRMTTKKATATATATHPFARTRKDGPPALRATGFDGPSTFLLDCDALNGFERRLVFFAALDEDVGYAGEEEDGEDHGVEGRGVVAFLDEPPIVDDSGDGGDVD